VTQVGAPLEMVSLDPVTSTSSKNSAQSWSNSAIVYLYVLQFHFLSFNE
jgi:hypothetical protein